MIGSALGATIVILSALVIMFQVYRRSQNNKIQERIKVKQRYFNNPSPNESELTPMKAQAVTGTK